MKEITITSGTLKGAFSLDYSYVQTTDEADKNDVKVSCNAPVHPDLRGAFDSLIPHLALICEQLQEKEVKSVIKNGFPEEEEEPHPVKQKFTIHSFKITGTGESEGVQLSGNRLLSIGKSISISTPKIKWDDEDYKFISELSEAVEHCKVEVNEYLNGKHAPNNQLDMFEGFGDEVDIEIVKSA